MSEGFPCPVFEPDEASLVTVKRVLHALATLLSWEVLINFSFDVQYLCRSSMSLIKALFFIAKYMGLFSQFANVYAKHRIHNQYNNDAPTAVCRNWLIHQLMSLLVILYCGDMLLMIRAYALYQKCRRLLWLFGIVMLFKTVAMVVVITYSAINTTYGYGCIPTRFSMTVVGICILEMFFHILILALTLGRSWYLMRSNNSASLPLLKLVMRDAAFIFVTLSAVHTISIADMFHKGHLIGVMLPINITGTSIATCRIIMNMRTFPADEPCVHSQVDGETEFEFTSIHDTGLITVQDNPRSRSLAY